MPLRMIDWKCPRCGFKWEELTAVTSQNLAARPRCKRGCAALADRQIGAPAIRTTDNMPRDVRQVTTAGHPMQGVHEKRGELVDPQLGRGFASRGEFETFIRTSGIEIVTPSEYSQRYLSHEPPPPRLEDSPDLLRESQDEFADMYDRAEAGALPPIERPMLSEDAEAQQVVDQMTKSAEVVDAAEGA